VQEPVRDWRTAKRKKGELEERGFRECDAAGRACAAAL
jgi:hypothetical protein